MDLDPHIWQKRAFGANTALQDCSGGEKGYATFSDKTPLHVFLSGAPQMLQKF